MNPKSFRLDQPGREQLAELAELYGENESIVIRRLIADQYQKEIEMKKHELQVPENAGRGLTSWIAVCSCGAHFDCHYDRNGLEWRKIDNKKCVHGPQR